MKRRCFSVGSQGRGRCRKHRTPTDIARHWQYISRLIRERWSLWRRVGASDANTGNAASANTGEVSLQMLTVPLLLLNNANSTVGSNAKATSTTT